MKKLLGIVVLGLLLSGNVYAAKYVLPSIFKDCDILTKKDPTSFQNISFVEEKKIKFWDRRKQKSSGWNQSIFKAFVFKATFKKGKDVSIRVNSEFTRIETSLPFLKVALKTKALKIL